MTTFLWWSRCPVYICFRVYVASLSIGSILNGQINLKGLRIVLSWKYSRDFAGLNFWNKVLATRFYCICEQTCFRNQSITWFYSRLGHVSTGSWIPDLYNFCFHWLDQHWHWSRMNFLPVVLLWPSSPFVGFLIRWTLILFSLKFSVIRPPDCPENPGLQVILDFSFSRTIFFAKSIRIRNWNKSNIIIRNKYIHL